MKSQSKVTEYFQRVLKGEMANHRLCSCVCKYFSAPIFVA